MKRKLLRGIKRVVGFTSLLLILAGQLCISPAYAKPGSADQQALVVSGRITSSADNESVPGVNVLIKGTLQGTVTDADGRKCINIHFMYI